MFIELVKRHPLFTTVSWVIRARSTDSTRYVINMLHAEVKGTGMEIVATDGRRLHVGQILEDQTTIPAGNYTIKKHTKTVIQLLTDEDGVTFPNYKQVIPDITGMNQVELNAVEENNSSILAVACHRYGKGFVNLDYLRDACGLDEGNGWVKIVENDELMNPIVFTHQLGLAVVMPVRVGVYCGWAECDQNEAKELAVYREKEKFEKAVAAGLPVDTSKIGG